jgi:diketogulonate reductase-like aldo/keto reductase
MSIPTFTLNNGVPMPALGFGVFQTAPEETTTAVCEALEVGYRHIDTAAAYMNEREVGTAIADAGISRAELFLETKVWISDYGYEETLHAFEKSARSWASISSTSSSFTSRCRLPGTRRWAPIRRSRSFTPTARCAPSA